MDAHKFRLMARDIARVAVAKTTERDVQAAKKATYGYGYLMRELDGLLDCMLNGPNDHLMPELHAVLDALGMLRKVQEAQDQKDDLPPELRKIMEEEFDAAYKQRFGVA